MNFTNFFANLTPTPDQSLLPNVWLTWETRTQGRLFLNCKTGKQQNHSEPWMPYKAYYLNYDQLKKHEVVVNSGSAVRFAYSKYHEDVKLLELAVVEMNTNRTGGAREWKFAEGGNRYFITTNKEIYSETGSLLTDDGRYINRFFAYTSHYSYRFKDFLGYLERVHTSPNFNEEFKKFIGSNMYISKNGKAVEIKYSYHIQDWYMTSHTKKATGKTQQLLDKLSTMPSRDLQHICKTHGALQENTNSNYYKCRNVKDIIVFEQLDDEWSVLRYCYRDADDNNVESYRVFVNENGDCKCAKLNTAYEWVPAQTQNGYWGVSYGRIINLDEATEKSKRLSYILPILTQMSESKQLTTLVLVLKHPELEKLFKMGCVTLATNLMNDNHVNANIKHYFGEPNKKAKTLYSAWGINKHQLEKLNQMMVNKTSGVYSSYRRASCITKLKRYFGNDISYMDNATFDRLAEFMCTIIYNNIIIEEIINDNIPEWINHMSRVFVHPNTPNNCTQILADTIRAYKYITNRPQIDWNFDCYSDIIRVHDALITLQRTEENERRARWNMDAAERIKKEDEMRKKIDEKRKHYEFEDTNFIIRLPHDNNEIISEGTKQNICIGGYTERHSTGHTNLFFLRKKESPDAPFYAIEMRDNNIIQIHGFGNKWLGNNPEAIPTVLRWMRQHNIKCSDTILTSTAKGYSGHNATCVPMPKID